MKKVRWLFLLMVLLSAFLNTQFNIDSISGNLRFGVGDVDTDNGYEINSFHSDININKDGVYNIVETINVTFGSEEEFGKSQGIYRYISTNVEAVREVDGKVKRNVYFAELSKPKSLTEQKMDYVGVEDGCYIFKFGTSDVLVNGLNITYKFSYNYAVPDDRYDSFDDFYYNLVGAGWTTDINNVSFKITFPESINGTETYFYSGKVGSSDKANISLTSTSDTVIEGTLNGSVKAGEAFTIRTILPDGYFSEVEKTSNGGKIAVIVVTCVLLLVILIVGILSKGKSQIVPVVNFDPPEGMSPLKMKAYISESGITTKDLSAMIIYWANAGYLKIIQDENKKFRLEKVKDLDKYDYEQEKKMFDCLVEIYKDGTVDAKDTDKRIKLGEEISSENIVLKASIGKRETTKSVTISVFMFVFVVLSMLSIAFLYCHEVNQIGMWVIKIICTVVGGVLLFVLSRRYLKEEIWGLSKGKVVGLCFAFFFSTLLFTNSTMSSLRDVTIMYGATKYIIAILVPVVCWAIGATLQVPENLRGQLGEIYGFANNLVVVETDKLKMMLKDDPSIFYRILPYTYVLGINQQFTKKFEGIAITAPEWLESVDLFDILMISMIHDSLANDFYRMGVMNIANKASTIGKTGGGSSSGGGFSGGGFGGGGGGRW